MLTIGAAAKYWKCYVELSENEWNNERKERYIRCGEQMRWRRCLQKLVFDFIWKLRLLDEFVFVLENSKEQKKFKQKYQMHSHLYSHLPNPCDSPMVTQPTLAFNNGFVPYLFCVSDSLFYLKSFCKFESQKIAECEEIEASTWRWSTYIMGTVCKNAYGLDWLQENECVLWCCVCGSAKTRQNENGNPCNF